MRTTLPKVAIFVFCVSCAGAARSRRANNQKDQSAAPLGELASLYRQQADRIIAAALADDKAWNRLAHLADNIGHRLSGSTGLERAVAWTQEILRAEGLDNVAGEPVMVPHWVRGQEQARLVAPFAKPLNMLGLGNSVGTPRRGIKAEVVVVRDFDELAVVGDQVAGRIVLFNHAMPAYTRTHGSGYGKASAYRTAGPSRAAELGAVAVLVRSLTAESLYTPHTGMLNYKKGVKKIPGAAITTEDADLIARLRAAGKTVTVELKMGARMLADAPSANVIAELRGREKPDEVVVLGAHLDSWDVGQGAHDDATGCIIMIQAATLLKKVGLTPRRTIRVVLFTNEENGLGGSKAYAKTHAEEVPKHVLAIESDSGGFAPRGFHVQGNEQAVADARDVVSLLAEIGADEAETGFSGADILPLARQGVPALGLWVEGERYFNYHHTHADTLDKVNPDQLKRNVAAVAVMAFIAAEMPRRFGAR